MAGLLASYGIKELMPSFFLSQQNNDSVDHIYRNFLNSDIRKCVRPCLPKGIKQKHLVTLSGMYILQVNAIKNIGVSYEERQKGNSARGSRTLLFELTDGTQNITAMEFESLQNVIKDVNKISHGTKVAVCDVLIRRGIALLKPNNFAVLGGNVVVDVIRDRPNQEDNTTDHRRTSY